MGLKLQCGCGQKVELEVYPEHAAQGVQFICPACGVDNSAVATQAVQQLYGIPATPANESAAKASSNLSSTSHEGRIRIQSSSHSAPVQPVTAAVSAPASALVAPICTRHYGHAVSNFCLVCQKPLCSKCMEVFGYVCSAFCRAKAEANHIDIPVYEHQSTVAQARFGRKVMRNILAIAALLIVIAGVWIWWEWVATMPRIIFAVTFPEKGYSGQARLSALNQSVVLHGGHLARYDLKTKREQWSHYLLDQNKIAENAAAALTRMKAAREKAISDGADPDDWKLPDQQQLTQNMVLSAESALTLHVQSENIWVQFPEKLVRYDWQNGSAGKEVSVPEGSGHWAARGSELVAEYQSDDAGKIVVHLDPASGEIRKDEFAPPKPVALAKTGPGSTAKTGSNLSTTASRSGGKMGTTSVGNSKAIDPKTAAQRYENMPLPSKLALPAVLAANANQERLKAELKGDSDAQPARELRGLAQDTTEHSSLVFTGDGFVELSVRLLETKTVERKVMKAAPKKAALDGEVSTGNSTAIANDLLNEMQRENVGDTIKEDISRYQVKLRATGEAGEGWTGEVAGGPQFFPLKTVHVLVAGESVFTFDKHIKKLWESKLSSKVIGGSSYEAGLQEFSQYGQGPCVERGARLYLFDQTILTAYEKTTGQPVWRLPSVGTAGIFFDEQGHIYVNTTTASPETVKYSRQIDINAKTRSQVVKLEENTGKILWRTEGDGMISYLSGKFIYTMELYEGDSNEGSGFLGGMKTGLEVPAHVRIRRISPRNGRVLWEHYQGRAPLDVQFDGNRIQLLFQKELQVLTFMSL